MIYFICNVLTHLEIILRIYPVHIINKSASLKWFKIKHYYMHEDFSDIKKAYKKIMHF